MPREVRHLAIDTNSFTGAYSPTFRLWSQTEEERCSFFGVSFDSQERIKKAAIDFERGRTWPSSFAVATGPLFLWHRFAYFIGLTNIYEAAQECDSDEFSSDSDGETTAPQAWHEDLSYWSTDENIRLVAFLSDPETPVRLFLSSYARRAGLIWSDANSDCLGSTLEFFLKYLLRSRVLPGITQLLQNSLSIAEAAKIELPRIYTVSRMLPDKFSQACASCWGSEATGLVRFILEQEVSSPSPIPAGDGENSANQPSPWGSGSSVPWTEVDTSSNHSDQLPLWWLSSVPPSLTSLLGPTAFPLTHSPGLLETSIRRVKKVTPLSNNMPASPPLELVSPDVTAVEVELRRNFLQVIMEPAPLDWLGQDFPVHAQRKVWKSPQQADTSPVLHDPAKDDIIVLAQDKDGLQDLLSEGLGLGGTWVQLARQNELANVEGASAHLWYVDNLTVVLPTFWTVDAQESVEPLD